MSIVGHIFIAAFNAEDMKEPTDERERRVLEKAGHYSGMVFGFLVVMVPVTYVFFQIGSLFFYAILGAMIIAQIVEYALQIFFLRIYFR